MVYLSDQPDPAASLFHASARGWQACDVAALSETQRRVWTLLGTGDQTWRCEAEGTGATGANRLVVLIDDAPRSQFDVLVDALAEGVPLPDGLVCLARQGRGFRGQRDRRWAALRGNLHLTVHYQLDLPATAAEALTMLPAVAAARSVSELTQSRLQPQIKWVNDLLVAGRKVAGVLTATHVQNDRLLHVVFGVGINLQHAPQLPATSSAPGPPAGALVEMDPQLVADRRRDDLESTALDTLVKHLDKQLNQLVHAGPRSLYDAYRAHSGFIGREVRIWPEGAAGEGCPGPIASGRVSDLLPDLSLVIEGRAAPIRSGRMELLDAESPRVQTARAPEAAGP